MLSTAVISIPGKHKQKPRSRSKRSAPKQSSSVSPATTGHENGYPKIFRYFHNNLITISDNNNNTNSNNSEVTNDWKPQGEEAKAQDVDSVVTDPTDPDEPKAKVPHLSKPPTARSIRKRENNIIKFWKTLFANSGAAITGVKPFPDLFCLKDATDMDRNPIAALNRLLCGLEKTLGRLHFEHSTEESGDSKVIFRARCKWEFGQVWYTGGGHDLQAAKEEAARTALKSIMSPEQYGKIAFMTKPERYFGLDRKRINTELRRKTLIATFQNQPASEFFAKKFAKLFPILPRPVKKIQETGSSEGTLIVLPVMKTSTQEDVKCAPLSERIIPVTDPLVTKSSKFPEKFAAVTDPSVSKSCGILEKVSDVLTEPSSSKSVIWPNVAHIHTLENPEGMETECWTDKKLIKVEGLKTPEYPIPFQFTSNQTVKRHQSYPWMTSGEDDDPVGGCGSDLTDDDGADNVSDSQMDSNNLTNKTIKRRRLENQVIKFWLARKPLRSSGKKFPKVYALRILRDLRSSGREAFEILFRSQPINMRPKFLILLERSEQFQVAFTWDEGSATGSGRTLKEAENNAGLEALKEILGEDELNLLCRMTDSSMLDNLDTQRIQRRLKRAKPKSRTWNPAAIEQTNLSSLSDFDFQLVNLPKTLKPLPPPYSPAFAPSREASPLVAKKLRAYALDIRKRKLSAEKIGHFQDFSRLEDIADLECNAVAALGSLFVSLQSEPCPVYTAVAYSRPIVSVKVECAVRGKHFVAEAPTEEVAKNQAAVMALKFLMGAEKFEEQNAKSKGERRGTRL